MGESCIGRGLLEYAFIWWTLHYKRRVSLNTSVYKVGLTEVPLYRDLLGGVFFWDGTIDGRESVFGSLHLRGGITGTQGQE